MTSEQIKKQVLKYSWEFWLDRPFGAFILSLFKYGQTRAYMKKAGVNAEWPAILFQKRAWYKSQKVWDDFAGQLEKYLRDGGTVFKVVRRCEQLHKNGKKQILAMLKSPEKIEKNFKQLYEILTQIMSFVWLAHGFEHVYLRKLQSEVPKFYKGDAHKLIGDMSYPVKKNAHNYMEQALRSGQPLEKVQKEFAWIKIRDGFSQGFTLKELAEERKKLRQTKVKHFKQIKPPKGLESLAKISQELVYFRTLRTDILYEFMYLARPITTAMGKKYGLKFEDLKNYSALDLISGHPKKYSENVTAISIGKEFALLDHAILNDVHKGQTELFGMVAYKGLARGRAKIVTTAHEIGKVKQGDILIAPTTAPSFILGMKKAAAFVTDEGGITSHTAIVAREMQKPCVIGTKNASRIFKDGDMVEVDANKGIIRLIKD